MRVEECGFGDEDQRCRGRRESAVITSKTDGGGAVS